MDALSIKPLFCTFSSSTPTLLAFSPKSSISLYSKTPESKPSSYVPPINPISFLAPLLLCVKKRTNAWASGVQAYSDSGESSGAYLQSGAIGVGVMSPFLATLAANPTFVSGVVAWFIAQSVKVVLNFFVERKWDFRILCASGGMPSSHSALCTALTTAVGLCHGISDPLFPVCLGFSLIVMFDATGVRRHAGIQAQVLNMIVEDLFQGHPISQRKLKELLGHTPSQVFAGAVLGIVVAYICCRSFLLTTSTVC